MFGGEVKACETRNGTEMRRSLAVGAVSPEGAIGLAEFSKEDRCVDKVVCLGLHGADEGQQVGGQCSTYPRFANRSSEGAGNWVCIRILR